MGFTKAQEYVEHLTAIDDALAKDPVSTLRALSEAYGVNFNDNNQISNSLQRQITEVKQSLAAQQAFIKEQQDIAARQNIYNFINAKDDAGNLKHPFWEEVGEEVKFFLQNGKTLEEAYDKATWINEGVREKMIAAQAKAELDSKVAAAGKAKEAGFSPKSKQTAPERELSLREELLSEYEKAFRG